MNRRFLLFVAVSVALSSMGCGPSSKPPARVSAAAPPIPPTIVWNYSLAQQKGSVVLDMDGATITFQGIHWNASARGSLIVAGPARSTARAVVGNEKFFSQYANGLNTMTFFGHTLWLTNAGTTLKIGAKEYSLVGRKQKILVKKDGTSHLM